jgi:hypothetical protein
MTNKSLMDKLLLKGRKRGAVPGGNMVIGVLFLVLTIAVLGIVLLFIFSVFGNISGNLNTKWSAQDNYTTAFINNGSNAVGSIGSYLTTVVLVGILVLIIALVSVILYMVFRFSGNTGNSGGLVG